MTAATAVVWRGEQARRTMRFSEMMISEDLTFALGIGKLNYEVLHQPQLLTRPSALAQFGFVRRNSKGKLLGGNTTFWLKYTLRHPVAVMRIGFSKVVGWNTIFWLTYALRHPVTIMKMGFVKVFGLERAHRLKRLISRSIR
jgi:hypothetical protein